MYFKNNFPTEKIDLDNYKDIGAGVIKIAGFQFDNPTGITGTNLSNISYNFTSNISNTLLSDEGTEALRSTNNIDNIPHGLKAVYQIAKKENKSDPFFSIGSKKTILVKFFKSLIIK